MSLFYHTTIMNNSNKKRKLTEPLDTSKMEQKKIYPFPGSMLYVTEWVPKEKMDEVGESLSEHRPQFTEEEHFIAVARAIYQIE